MGIGDLTEFRLAGKTLYSLGLIKGTEGNLSTFDGRVLHITRAGACLFELTTDDVVEGTLDEPPPNASSDLRIHLRLYGEPDARAVVHAHPGGSVPEGWMEGQPHGIYVHGGSLEEAVGAAIRSTRTVHAVAFEGDVVRILDQTRLPNEEHYIECRTVDEVAAAIRRLAVRGAPVLGIAAAYAMVLAARGSAAPDRGGVLLDLDAAGRSLVDTRPTAVNIRWAVDRVRARATDAEGAEGVAEAVLGEARIIEREDAQACSTMGRIGRKLIPDGANVLTHCNTGMLCTAGIGTALGVIYSAHLAGKRVHVWVDETRPVWQGARLTTWELERLAVPHTLIADAAAGSLMAAGQVDLIIVGADRIAANGDVANKIGTYPLAVLARHHGIPFYVAAPTSTVDPATLSGASIVVEERDPAEVTRPLGLAVAPGGTPAANPSFDVTPADLVTAIVTERGIVHPPYDVGLREVAGERGTA